MGEDIKKYLNLFESTQEVEYQEVTEEDHDEPASEEEEAMAGDQLEFLKYAAEEIKKNINDDGSFPEWFQNKLSGVYSTMKTLHAWMEGDSRNDDMEGKVCKDCGCEFNHPDPDCDCEHDATDPTGDWWVDKNGNGIPDALESCGHKHKKKMKEDDTQFSDIDELIGFFKD